MNWPSPPRTHLATLRRKLAVAAVTVLTALVVAAVPAASAGASQSGAPKPTIVLVHGAFADASGWNEVVERLQRSGYTAYAPANPLRGLASDAAYIRSFLSTVRGPIVLVGHSYGGAVITNAATGNPNVKALVYVAAYGLDQGESVAAANSLGGGHTDLTEHLVVRPFPGSGDQNGDAYVDPAEFPRIFAADLPRQEAEVLAAAQRPGVLSSLLEPSGVPAWKKIPSWYLVASNDNLIPPVAERTMAARMHATTVEIASSHVAMMSHPADVVRLIRAAAGR
ncbi:MULTISPECIES: alpha/beta fold hydrolase [unclassified Pseudofrankia]|uniref:alpha/beta fold hydrolase n=1 Tax=unclassified Pseudofrankia TaxID=2994372 RepID=UPI0008DAEA58|nr:MULTISPECIES: alpha/beta hydrolase [unclassified Pseudofrankia]MDT3439577.1 alpha/beta hydrolase [Pseudofrankia sp. BMG5.37]OHV48750.1 alpha/beta hydrolase [Pseudofrankia sp. BMG5.36]